MVKKAVAPKAVAKKASTAVVKQAPQRMGRGMEEANADDFAIPFLRILQPLSPQVESVKGAKAGMIINTVTNELLTEVVVTPAFYQRRFIRWAPRSAGGGFKGQFVKSQVDEMISDGTVVQEDNRLYYPMPDGTVNEKKCDLCSDTRSYFVVDEEGQSALISMASSGIKTSKQWASKIQMRGGDIWGSQYRLTTERRENDDGFWFGWVVELVGDAPAETQELAEALWNSVASGEIKARMDLMHNDD